MPLDLATTVSLNHFTGTDAATACTDESGKTWTFNGNAQLDTGIVSPLVNGVSVLLLDGTGDYLSSADHADWASIKTADLWVYHSSLTGAQVYFSQWTDGSNGHRLFKDASHNLIYQIWSGGSAVVSMSAASGFSATTWYHLALVHNGTDYRVYKNGTSLMNVTDTDNLGNYTGTFILGADAGGVAAANYLNGAIAEARFNTSVIWTAAFTPNKLMYAPNNGFF